MMIQLTSVVLRYVSQAIQHPTSRVGAGADLCFVVHTTYDISTGAGITLERHKPLTEHLRRLMQH